MKKIVKESLILIIISFICNFNLFMIHFICDGIGFYPFYQSYMEYIFYIVSVFFEIIVFSVVGAKLKIHNISIIVFFVLSTIVSSIACSFREVWYGWFGSMLLNVLVPQTNSYTSCFLLMLFENSVKAITLFVFRKIHENVLTDK